MCRLDVRVRPPWMAGVSKMQEQFIDLAPDVPEPGHPTPSADIALVFCFDTLFENIVARLTDRFVVGRLFNSHSLATESPRRYFTDSMKLKPASGEPKN